MTRVGFWNGQPQPDPQTYERAQQFVARYRALCHEYGIVVTSCGCCAGISTGTKEDIEREIDMFTGSIDRS